MDGHLWRGKVMKGRRKGREKGDFLFFNSSELREFIFLFLDSFALLAFGPNFGFLSFFLPRNVVMPFCRVVYLTEQIFPQMAQNL